MFNRKSAAEATGPRYLEPLTRVPNLSELQKQSEMAQVTRQREILQAWYLDSGKGEELPPSYAIGVILPREPYNAQPVWSFYEVLPKELRTHWKYETADASLIHNMILCALPEQSLAPELDNSYAYTSTLSRSETESVGGPVLSKPDSVDTMPDVPDSSADAVTQSEPTSTITVDRSYERDDGLALTPPSDLPVAPPPKSISVSTAPAKELLDSRQAEQARAVPGESKAPQVLSDLQKEFGYLVDPSKIGALESLLYNPVTGLLSAAAFAHHLSNEFTRRRVCGGSFTLVVMRLRTASGASVNLDKAAERINLIKSIVRPCDLLYQIDNYGFIMILPDIEPQKVRQYCSDFLRQLVSKKGANNQERIFIKVGVATAPNDGLTSAQVFESAMTRENSSITAL